MTHADLFETAGYFANPIRNSRIEIEARQKTITAYGAAYFTLTGTNLPVGSDAVYILPDNANKWGREMRLYFVCADRSMLPLAIAGLETEGGRPGYEMWNQRLNNKDIIDELLHYKFVIGNPQDEAAIRASIPTLYIADFDRGYNLP